MSPISRAALPRDTGKRWTRYFRAPVWLAQAALLASVLASAGCGATGPDSSGALGPIGPFPADLTGKVALATMVGIDPPTRTYIETKVHVIDVVDAVDNVIYTVQDALVEGLSWAPDGQHLLVQTYEPKIGPNGENQGVSELHLLDTSGSQDHIIFPNTIPQFHPAYSATGRVAYFGGWSSQAASGIFVDDGFVHAVVWDINSYLDWAPNDSALFYTSDAGSEPGLARLTLADGSVTQLMAPVDNEVIIQPAVAPDGSRIAVMRFAGSHQSEELWTVSADGSNPTMLTSGFADEFATWTPGGNYLAFVRYGASAPGVYIIAPAGGTPTRVIGTGNAGNIVAAAWSR